MAPTAGASSGRIVEVGTDFQVSSLEVLSRARITDIPAYLERIRDGGIAEIALLSTCNRFELYAATNDPEDTLATLQAEVHGLLGGNGDFEMVVRRDGDAVAHLVAVAAGLESALLGEHEILGQVRRARATADRAGTFGMTLERLFDHALHHGRRIRRALGLSHVRRSLTELAADWVAIRLIEPERRVAVVVGAGETASQMARHLRALGIGSLTIVNRSLARSRELAEAVEGRIERLDRLPSLLRDTDLVVLATAAPEPLLTETAVRGALEGREEALLVVDLGLSPNAEPGIAGHASVKTLTLSDVVALAVAESQVTEMDAVDAETLVQDSVADFTRARARRPPSERPHHSRAPSR